MEDVWPALCAACERIGDAEPCWTESVDRTNYYEMSHVLYQIHRHHASRSELEACVDKDDCQMCALILAQMDSTHVNESTHCEASSCWSRKWQESGPSEDGSSTSIYLEVAAKLEIWQASVAILWKDETSRRVRASSDLRLIFEKYTHFKPSTRAHKTSRGSSYTGSPERLNLAREWLQTCEDSHAECRRPNGEPDPVLPTRVVDVGVGGEPRVALHEPRPDERGQYVCLSHCWGQPASPFVTSTRTVDARRKGMSLDSMPRTFGDAIAVTRRLGYRYLWIDSLCILQSDGDGDDGDARTDWLREAPKMGQYYGNSSLTITADAASGDDQGLFCHGDDRPKICRAPVFDRLARRLAREFPDRVRHYSYGSADSQASVLECYLFAPGSHYDMLVSPVSTCKDKLRWLTALVHREHALPLHTRGWTLQEWMLSPRTLSFDDAEVRWRCRAMQTCECLAQGIRLGGECGLWEYWPRMAEAFGGRQLTKATDALACLAGLAATFADAVVRESDVGAMRRPADLYRAGHWVPDLRRGLVWFARDSMAYEPPGPDRLPHGPVPAQAARYIAPSWSWLSARRFAITTMTDVYSHAGTSVVDDGDGSVLTSGLNRRSHDALCIIRACTTVAPPGVDPLCGVADGRLVLEGHLGRMSVCYFYSAYRRVHQLGVSWADDDVEDVVEGDCDSPGTGRLPRSDHDHDILLASDDPSVPFPHPHVWCMPLFFDFERDWSACLALVPAVDRNNTAVYRRVGLVLDFISNQTKRDELIRWFQAKPKQVVQII